MRKIRPVRGEDRSIAWPSPQNYSTMEEVSVSICGTCYGMCPDREIRVRQANDLVHYFERQPGTKQSVRSTQDKVCMIKEFRRPAPGVIASRPCDLRPASVLLKTIDYLFNNIVPRSEVPWCRVYDFVFDRLRAVQQDMVIQRIGGHDAVHILERNVRFLVYAGYRLCVETRDDFDPEINHSHVQECLKRLLVLYDSDDSACHCHQSDFVALYLLYNLGSSEAVLHALSVKQKLNSSDVFKNSFLLSLAWHTGNFMRVLKLSSHLPSLHLCALHRHIDRVRCSALNVICASIGSRAQSIQVSVLSKWLVCDINEMEILCSKCGLTTITDSAISLSRTKFQEPSPMPRLTSRQIDSKLATESKSLSQLLLGLPCDVH